MTAKKNSIPGICTAMLMSAILAIPSTSEACTRFVYHGVDGDVITARSMDWKLDVGTNLWIFPRGTKLSGEAGPNSIHWTSKYGSVMQDHAADFVMFVMKYRQSVRPARFSRYQAKMSSEEIAGLRDVRDVEVKVV
jgi:Linear amide C-N hydrolases, choloylglycine hydrolase family